MKRVLAAILLAGSVFSTLHAMGRKPNPDQGFPDYNRLDLHPKVLLSTPTPNAEAPASPPPFVPSPIKVNLPSDVDAAPKPPPKAIPTPDGSEPAMPDDMLNTLVPSTTGQK